MRGFKMESFQISRGFLERENMIEEECSLEGILKE